ncbi:uncharacterized lipoprotein YddW (UPF0748 family) [Allostreptomyces psammosilenae]|uniref:Uncharacterized lipoprotein YddW (UPF0748 family) n=1 Tax=Allostreptomyces psammosilenae TaxID=1892865 RepID=A0A852ZTB7_9ACTN|nr:family 10 glycosylhydrolase [Allostreptomyces psammosilenae]NYI04034.1 uncharacterized lipoprotein YddW (UPF0748 family) [Allostreptomyces psammosilenae]
MATVGALGAALLGGAGLWRLGPQGAVAATRSAVPPSGEEMRGTWVATTGNLNWPSRPGLPVEEQRAELDAWLDLAVRHRMNTVVLQVRANADTLWPSALEPWSAVLTGTQGQDPGWDPLGHAVEQAHARGLELHAWFNPYRIAAHDDPDRLAEDHPARLHPEWVIAYQGKLYYDPGRPEVQRHVRDVVLEVAHAYPVDAVHWDDYFYPQETGGVPFGDDASWESHGQGFEDRAAWRRDNVNTLVRETGREVRAVREGLRFGISPSGVWRNASADPRGSDTQAFASYDDLHADSRRWVRKEWIDYVVPQVYWEIGHSAADYDTVVRWWAEQVRDTSVQLAIGEAVYKVGAAGQPAAWHDAGELSRHLELAGTLAEVRGHVLFSAGDVRRDPLGAVTRMVDEHWS